MAYEKDLQLSAKFAYHLNKLGMLDALVVSYQNFRDSQNAPFIMKDKRVAIQSTFNDLCVLYASKGNDKITSSEILKEAKEIVNEFWNDSNEEVWEKRPESESTKMVTEKIVDIKKEQDKNKKIYTIDIPGKGNVKDFHAECSADSKEKAYEVMLKQHPGLKGSPKSAVIKIIKLKK